MLTAAIVSVLRVLAQLVVGLLVIVGCVLLVVAIFVALLQIGLG